MVFNSLTFAVFFVIVLAVHSAPVGWTARKVNLLVASYLFYAAWNPPFVVLIWLSTAIDWFAARRIARAASTPARRALLALSLVANLGILGYFKYGAFLLDSFTAALAALGVHYSAAGPDIFLPIGISFYTFQTMSYTIDVYRGRSQPASSWLDFALYVTFFPQLVAGPIVRAGEFLPQCLRARRATSDQLGWGATLLTIGLFQKVVLADAILAPVSDQVFGNALFAGNGDAWLGTLAFSGQIFFDFAGYSTCAIGVALCFGFTLPDNFRAPYAALGFSEFWRRWHISLSTWLRDYLYISLGGNRRGRPRTYLNLGITMFLGGLWHGASWKFVIWGMAHGLFLVLERVVRAWLGAVGRPLRWYARLTGVLLTYGLVCVAWVLFRASDLPDAIALLVSMFTGADGERLPIQPVDVALVLAVTGGLLLAHWRLRGSSVSEAWARYVWPVRSLMIAAMWIAIVLTSGHDRAFIYFQF